MQTLDVTQIPYNIASHILYLLISLFQGLTGPDGPAGKDGPAGEGVSVSLSFPHWGLLSFMLRCVQLSRDDPDPQCASPWTDQSLPTSRKTHERTWMHRRCTPIGCWCMSISIRSLMGACLCVFSVSLDFSRWLSLLVGVFLMRSQTRIYFCSFPNPDRNAHHFPPVC